MENKHWWWVVAGFVLLSISIVAADGEIWEESEHEVLIRSERGAKNRETCRYVKGAWSECDSKTNIRSRTLTLKKGDPATCERNKTIEKKCKKAHSSHGTVAATAPYSSFNMYTDMLANGACRYEKSSWSECSLNGEMSRTDKLKANSDPTCEQSRRVTKKCNKNKQVKATKDKGRRNRQ